MSYRCGTECDAESTPELPSCPECHRGCLKWTCPISMSLSPYRSNFFGADMPRWESRCWRNDQRNNVHMRCRSPLYLQEIHTESNVNCMNKDMIVIEIVQFKCPVYGGIKRSCRFFSSLFSEVSFYTFQCVNRTCCTYCSWSKTSRGCDSKNYDHVTKHQEDRWLCDRGNDSHRAY